MWGAGVDDFNFFVRPGASRRATLPRNKDLRKLLLFLDSRLREDAKVGAA